MDSMRNFTLQIDANTASESGNLGILGTMTFNARNPPGGPSSEPAMNGGLRYDVHFYFFRRHFEAAN